MGRVQVREFFWYLDELSKAAHPHHFSPGYREPALDDLSLLSTPGVVDLHGACLDSRRVTLHGQLKFFALMWC